VLVHIRTALILNAAGAASPSLTGQKCVEIVYISVPEYISTSSAKKAA
jgi:hypothetical protein